MTSDAVVNRYANALVDVVVKPSAGIRPAVVVEELKAFNATVESSEDLRTVLASPAVSIARKRLVIRRIAEALGLERIVLNFILVMTDRRRETALGQVIDAFELLLDERLGFARAEIRSAYELNAEQRERLSAEMAKLAGTQVRMRFAVDSSLIGGVTAKIGSKVYDGSVRGQLDGLREHLQVS